MLFVIKSLRHILYYFSIAVATARATWKKFFKKFFVGIEPGSIRLQAQRSAACTTMVFRKERDATLLDGSIVVLTR